MLTSCRGKRKQVRTGATWNPSCQDQTGSAFFHERALPTKDDEKGKFSILHDSSDSTDPVKRGFHHQQLLLGPSDESLSKTHIAVPNFRRRNREISKLSTRWSGVRKTMIPTESYSCWFDWQFCLWKPCKARRRFVLLSILSLMIVRMTKARCGCRCKVQLSSSVRDLVGAVASPSCVVACSHTWRFLPCHCAGKSGFSLAKMMIRAAQRKMIIRKGPGWNWIFQKFYVV